MFRKNILTHNWFFRKNRKNVQNSKFSIICKNCEKNNFSWKKIIFIKKKIKFFFKNFFKNIFLYNIKKNFFKKIFSILKIFINKFFRLRFFKTFLSKNSEKTRFLALFQSTHFLHKKGSKSDVYLLNSRPGAPIMSLFSMPNLIKKSIFKVLS